MDTGVVILELVLIYKLAMHLLVLLKGLNNIFHLLLLFVCFSPQISHHEGQYLSNAIW